MNFADACLSLPLAGGAKTEELEDELLCHLVGELLATREAGQE
jgi:hypothetical protein